MFLLNVFIAEELSVGIYLSICLFVCLSVCLSVFYTLCSCRFVFWWLAVPWWARNVSLAPLCITLWWQSLIMSLVRWWSHGNHAGNLADSCRDELQSLPLHLKIPFMSLITPNWARCCLKFRFSSKDFWDSNIRDDSLNNTSSLLRLPEPTGLTGFEDRAVVLFTRRMT